MVAQVLAREFAGSRLWDGPLCSSAAGGGLRRFERVDTYVPASLLADGIEHSCFVINISAGGALVHRDGPFPDSGPLSLKIADFAPLPAQLVRTNRDNHGLSFLADPSEVEGLVQRIVSEPGISRDRRLQARRRVLLAGSFYLGTSFVQARVGNLSAGGAYLASDTPAEPGSELDLQLARFGELPVRVAWADSKGMGVAFAARPDAIAARLGNLLSERA